MIDLDHAPLSDLHRHLDGSLRPTTLAALAAERGVVVPAGLGFAPGMGLTQALACFEVTLAVLQDAAALRRVAAEIVDDAAGEGVTTLEVRFAPQLHGRAGLTVADAVDAALARGPLAVTGDPDDPDITLRGAMRWCAQQPATPAATFAAWRAGRFRFDGGAVAPPPPRAMTAAGARP